MSNDRTSGSQTGRNVRRWVGAGALFVIAAIVFSIVGSTGWAISFFAIGGAMIALSRNLP